MLLNRDVSILLYSSTVSSELLFSFVMTVTNVLKLDRELNRDVTYFVRFDRDVSAVS